MKTNPVITFLNQEDVDSLINIKEALFVVREAFKQDGLGKTWMPPKVYLPFLEHNGDLRTMPSSIESLKVAGVKNVNVHPDNPKQGLPTVMATMTLVSTRNGMPVAFMEAGLITDLRTGAAGAVAAEVLSKKDSSVVGLVGLGNQAKTQLSALMLVRDIKTVKVYDLSEKARYSFKEWAEKKFDVEVFPKDSIQEACDCDILVTTTPVRTPIVKAEWIKPGTHINAIGADAEGKEELDPYILRKAKVVVDDEVQASHSGEINVPVSTGTFSTGNIYTELGKIVCGEILGRETDEEITVFDSTGLAIQDLATAELVYRKALEKKVGKKFGLFF